MTISHVTRLAVPAVVGLALAGIGWFGVQSASADPVTPQSIRPPVFLLTVGPYIGPSAAADVSARAAKGPIVRQEVSFNRYGELMPWLHIAGGGTVDPERAVYVVVNSVPTANQRPPGLLTGRDTCNWYAQVVDATSSTIYSYVCGEGVWPEALPATFRNIKP